jgi:hypothetical protein
LKSVLGHHVPNLSRFGDIEGKLDLLRVECTKCDRKGRYKGIGQKSFRVTETEPASSAVRSV